MSPPPGYQVILGDKFVQDLQRLAADARRDPTGRGAFLRQQVLRQIKDLAAGRSDRHHPLGYEPGKGDLRDCVAAYVQSDPQQKAVAAPRSGPVRQPGPADDRRAGQDSVQGTLSERRPVMTGRPSGEDVQPAAAGAAIGAP